MKSGKNQQVNHLTILFKINLKKMKTATISKINGITEWKWEHGIVYYFKLEMDNGERIELGKKSNDAFKVWDEVKYEDYIDAKGYTKQKEVKENPFKKSYNPEANNRGAMVWLAIKTAFEKEYSDEKDFDKAATLARKIFAVAMDMYEGKEDAKDDAKEEVTEQSEDKPRFNKEQLDMFTKAAGKYKNADEALKVIKSKYKIWKEKEAEVRKLYESLEVINDNN